jgi:hypothetical protein
MNYSYIREAFNPDKPNNNVLSIQLSLDGFSFYVADKESINRPIYFFSKNFDLTGPGGMIKELEDFRLFDGKVFNKTRIIFHTPEFCLIPDSIYEPETVPEFMRLIQPLPDKFKLCTTEIPAIQAKVAFYVQPELKTTIESKFNESTLLHSGVPTVHFGIKQNKNACLIHYYGKSISITVFVNNNLRLFNIFSIKDPNDLVYYTLSSLKSCKLKSKETVVYLSGINNEESEVFKILARYISKPVMYIPELIESDIPGFPTSLLFNHLEDLNCAL